MNRKHNDPAYTEMRKEYPRTWRIWYRMNKRCKIGQNGNYVDVHVCDEWNIDNGSNDAFLQFLDDMGPSEGELEIDRINPFGIYEPGNCRWVTVKVNRQNKRMHLDGTLDNLRTAKKNGICGSTYYGRLRRGWHPDDAATLPLSSTKYRNRII